MCNRCHSILRLTDNIHFSISLLLKCLAGFRFSKGGLLTVGDGDNDEKQSN